MTKVKICGITNLADAQTAVEYGADALGFIFASSPREVTPKKAAEIIQRIGILTVTVGVFVDAPRRTVLDTLRLCRLDALQFHGDEDDKYCAYFAKYCKIIKAVSIRDKTALRSAVKYKHADALLFDTYSAERRGGTGKVFDWRLLQKHGLKKPLIIGGGINAGNCTKIIRMLKPYALDVSSSIEIKPGKKDRKLMAGLLKEIKKTNCG